MNTRYLEERAMLAPRNDIVHKVNDYVSSLIGGDEPTYLSANSICKGSINVEE